MAIQYATPETLPTGNTCRSLFIPDDEMILGAVRGALKTLTEPYYWEKVGAVTPEDAADAMLNMFDMFCFNQGICRMVGEIFLWTGSIPPDDSNLLLCDGTHVSNEDYPALYEVIGTSFGGTGATDFALPDLRGRVPIGESAGHSLASSGGEETHTLTTAEMPTHSHTYVPPVFNVDIEAPGAPDPIAAGIGLPVQTGDAGGNGAHNNMQPYLTLNYYIVAA